MALGIYEQFTQFFDDKEHILFVFEDKSDIDAIASSVALATWLEGKGKNIDVVSHEFSLPRKASFLSRAQDFRSAFPHLKKFTISVDVKKNGIDELSYDVKDEKLHIYITPKQGFISPAQIQTAESNFRYDAIVLINTGSYVALGSLYEHNSDVFHKLPTLLLDHRPEVKKMANVNIVDITASSTTEVLFSLFSQIDETSITKDIATALLTGMIAQTNSFKHDYIPPHSLERAGKLMHMGADRSFIIKQLYQTKTLSSLKLWGQTLSHLQHNPDIDLVYSTLTREDFIRSGAEPEDLYDIIDELIANAPAAKIILLLHEGVKKDQETIHCLLYTTQDYSAKSMLSLFQGTGNDDIAYATVKSQSLQKTAELVIAAISRAVTHKT